MTRGPRRVGTASVALGAALAALSALSACQSSTPPAADEPRSAAQPFPTPSELEKLGEEPPRVLARIEIDDVAAWRLAGPFPERVEVVPHASASPVEALLGAAVAERPGLAVASEAMHCSARELARFVAERGKMAPPALTAFAAGRCGALVGAPRTQYLHGEAPAGVSEQALAGHWRAQIEALLALALAGGPVDAGIALARAGSRAAVVVVSAPRRVQVTPFSPVAVDGRVAFAGEVLGAAEEVSAAANQGALGFEACEPDPAVRPPRFAFRCPLARGDESAAIDVMVRERGRFLAETAFGVLARAPGEEAALWRRSDHAPSRVAANAAGFAEAVHGALDVVRKGEGLRNLALSKPQSKVADELAPHVLGASLGLGSPALADLAALGLVAGWGVGGAIRGAGMASALVAGAFDGGRFVDAALERPSGRASLLDPEARVLAVGSLASEAPPAVAAVAVTYALFGEEDFAAAAARLRERIGAARAGAGRSASRSRSATTSRRGRPGAASWPSSSSTSRRWGSSGPRPPRPAPERPGPSPSPS